MELHYISTYIDVVILDIQILNECGGGNNIMYGDTYITIHGSPDSRRKYRFSGQPLPAHVLTSAPMELPYLSTYIGPIGGIPIVAAQKSSQAETVCSPCQCQSEMRPDHNYNCGHPVLSQKGSSP